MEDKAHDYFLRAIQYADIVTHTSGAVFFHVEWYKIAQRRVQGYRRRREGFDLTAIAKQREPFLLILKPKLEACWKNIQFKTSLFKAVSLFQTPLESRDLFTRIVSQFSMLILFRLWMLP
jgi:hypothetical protein